MVVSGWLFLAQQVAASLCMVLAVGRALGAPTRVGGRQVLCALAGALAAAGTFAAGSAAVRWTLVPMLCALPILAYPTLFPASLRALPGLTLLAVMTALGWGRLLRAAGLAAAPSQLAACALLLMLPRLVPAAPSAKHAALRLRIGRRTVHADALVDTGNLLRDPVTGLPVIVVAPHVLQRMIPQPAPDRLAPGMRLMPVRTFAGQALMILIRPDEVCVGRRSVQAMLALSLDPTPRFEALVPAVFSTAELGG